MPVFILRLHQAKPVISEASSLMVFLRFNCPAVFATAGKFRRPCISGDSIKFPARQIRSAPTQRIIMGVEFIYTYGPEYYIISILSKGYPEILRSINFAYLIGSVLRRR